MVRKYYFSTMSLLVIALAMMGTIGTPAFAQRAEVGTPAFTGVEDVPETDFEKVRPLSELEANAVAKLGLSPIMLKVSAEKSDDNWENNNWVYLVPDHELYENFPIASIEIHWEEESSYRIRFNAREGVEPFWLLFEIWGGRQDETYNLPASKYAENVPIKSGEWSELIPLPRTTDDDVEIFYTIGLWYGGINEELPELLLQYGKFFVQPGIIPNEPTPTDTPTATATEIILPPTPTVTSTPTHTPTATDTPTTTLTPTATNTAIATDAPTDTSTPTATEVILPPTPTDTSTSTPTATNTPTATKTDAPTSTATSIPTYTPTLTPTDTPTDIPTDTPLMLWDFNPPFYGLQTGPVKGFNEGALIKTVEVPEWMIDGDGNCLAITLNAGQGIAISPSTDVLLGNDPALLSVLFGANAPGAQVTLIGHNSPEGVIDGQKAYNNTIGNAVPVQDSRWLKLTYKSPSGRILPCIQVVNPNEFAPVTVYFDLLMVEAFPDQRGIARSVQLTPDGSFDASLEGLLRNINGVNGGYLRFFNGSNGFINLNVDERQTGSSIAMTSDADLNPLVSASVNARNISGNGMFLLILNKGYETIGLSVFKQAIGRFGHILAFGGSMEQDSLAPLYVIVHNDAGVLSVDDVLVYGGTIFLTPAGPNWTQPIPTDTPTPTLTPTDVPTDTPTDTPTPTLTSTDTPTATEVSVPPTPTMTPMPTIKPSDDGKIVNDFKYEKHLQWTIGLEGTAKYYHPSGYLIADAAPNGPGRIREQVIKSINSYRYIVARVRVRADALPPELTVLMQDNAEQETRIIVVEDTRMFENGQEFVWYRITCQFLSTSGKTFAVEISTGEGVDFLVDYRASLRSGDLESLQWLISRWAAHANDMDL